MTAILIAVVVLVLAVPVVVHVCREAARDARWADAMVELGRRCPDCRGLGWHFGPPGTGDRAISTPTCTTCNGEGRLP